MLFPEIVSSGAFTVTTVALSQLRSRFAVRLPCAVPISQMNRGRSPFAMRSTAPRSSHAVVPRNGGMQTSSRIGAARPAARTGVSESTAIAGSAYSAERTFHLRREAAVRTFGGTAVVSDAAAGRVTRPCSAGEAGSHHGVLKRVVLRAGRLAHRHR